MIFRLLVLVMVGSMISHNAFSEDKTFNSEVVQVLVDDSNYGGCMVRLSVDPQTQLANCGSGFASLDCLKQFPESTAGIAANKLAQAQLALVTGREVRLRITDTRKVNGYCFVNRIDVK